MEREFKTTFWSDFTIADKFGVDAIKNTYARAFKEWKDNIEYITELSIVLNWKSWEHYDEKNEILSKLYIDIWNELDSYLLDTLKDNDLKYYLRETD